MEGQCIALAEAGDAAVVGDVVAEAGLSMPTQEKSRPKSLLKCWIASLRPGPHCRFQKRRRNLLKSPISGPLRASFAIFGRCTSYTWPDGQVIYLNGITGEVVQYTTFGEETRGTCQRDSTLDLLHPDPQESADLDQVHDLFLPDWNDQRDRRHGGRSVDVFAQKKVSVGGAADWHSL